MPTASRLDARRRAAPTCASAASRPGTAGGGRWPGCCVAGAVGTGALAASTLLTGPGGVPASAAGAGTEPVGHPMSVRVEAGDSLWSIAEVHRGTVPIARYVEALIDLNGGTVIEAGQLVRLP